MAFIDRMYNVTLAVNRLPAQAGLFKVVLEAGALNGGIIMVGKSTSMSITLAAGDTYELPVENLNEIYVQGSVTGDSLGIHMFRKGGM